jgi:Flp pilus assembly pilin Flp
MRQFLLRLWAEERAENLPEYGLLLILICLTTVSTVGRMAAKVNNICSNASTQMSVAAANPSLMGGSLAYTTESPANPQSMSKNDTKPQPTQ